MTIKASSKTGGGGTLLAPYFNDIFIPKDYESAKYYSLTTPYTTQSSSTYAADVARIVPFIPFNDVEVSGIGIYNSTTASPGASLRMGIYGTDNMVPGEGGNPAALIDETAEITIDATAAHRIGALSADLLKDVLYWLLIVNDASIGFAQVISSSIRWNTRGEQSLNALTGDSAMYEQYLSAPLTYGALPADASVLSLQNDTSGPLLYLEVA